MNIVKPKKHLGQHFLRDEAIARRIVDNLHGHGGYDRVLEIGPGTGVLSKYLISDARFTWWGMDVDTDSIAYLHKHYPDSGNNILEQDFLRTNVQELFNGEKVGVIGNFPYNISSQILFKILEYRNLVPEMVGMFQKEVAVRIVSGPDGKVNGILSILCQAFYDVEYLFQVDEHVFTPPPKVKSAVIRFKRNNTLQLDCDEKKFFTVVKTAFNQRRKTLRNSLKSMQIDWELPKVESLKGKRAEELEVADFVEITLAAKQ
ncbi:MAG: 16S rRNA (adenine(1518)-N(6)/adenine(1519)-N(6))-dimethyltransferase RsmA [Bacteroidetes bacterium]|nr:MAG: 16S rRNA (adenine(1518)-N(6)/adenine(1519)-N(6))-dimethyltransferase RsmA [Bacteroidota bacterium]